MKHFKFTSILLILGAVFLSQPSFAMLEMIKPLETTNNDFVKLSKEVKNQEDVKAMAPIMQTMLMDQFLKLTPAKFKELTGEKLGLKRTLQLKAAQKLMKNHQNQKKGADISKGLYVAAVIFGWGWLVMGLMDDWSGNDWWTNLILTALCWLPGVIHGLIKMKKYYK
jgi:hypothetical protein